MAADSWDLDSFFREGYYHVPCALPAEEISALRALTDTAFENRESIDPKFVSFVGSTFVLRRGAEYDPALAALIEREPFHSLAAAALGTTPAFNALNVIRNEPGQAISNWHVDDTVELPLPPDIPRYDARIKLPVFWLTVQLALSDIPDDAHGPTQFVPGSHYSGRKPVQESPEFEGRGPVSVYCQAGDAYLTNHQCWHRGAPNLSENTRYVLQLQYAARWADRRFRGVA
ncbi:MAG: phytanoyl-CoA dioxygenase family protein [Armatimonas sp.]